MAKGRLTITYTMMQGGPDGAVYLPFYVRAWPGMKRGALGYETGGPRVYIRPGTLEHVRRAELLSATCAEALRLGVPTLLEVAGWDCAVGEGTAMMVRP